MRVSYRDEAATLGLTVTVGFAHRKVSARRPKEIGMPANYPGKKLVLARYGQSHEDAVDNILRLEDSPLPDVTKLEPYDVLVGVRSASVFIHRPADDEWAVSNHAAGALRAGNGI